MVWPDNSIGGKRFIDAQTILKLLAEAIASRIRSDGPGGGHSTQNETLLSYLAGDSARRQCVKDYAQKLATADKLNAGRSEGRDTSADASETPSLSINRLHDSSSEYRGPLESPLIEGVMIDWQDMVRMLLRIGVDGNRKGHSGMTALGVAKANGSDSMIALLQSKGLTDEGTRPQMFDWWKGEEAWLNWDGWWWQIYGSAETEDSRDIVWGEWPSEWFF